MAEVAAGLGPAPSAERPHSRGARAGGQELRQGKQVGPDSGAKLAAASRWRQDGVMMSGAVRQRVRETRLDPGGWAIADGIALRVPSNHEEP